METSSVSLGHSIFPINYSNTKTSSPRITNNPSIISTTRHGRFHFSTIKSYKQYDFQDFHGYAKPSRLLGATQPKLCTQISQENSLNLDNSQCFFKVDIETSNAFGSRLSDQNAGVLLCLIDSNGDSILHRIPVIFNSNSAEPNPLHFQRGSVDEFCFLGPKLQGIQALWVSIESGQWRLAGLSLTVISACLPSLSEGNDEEQIQFTAFQYGFEVDDILLGEGTEISVVELRPSLVSELSGADPYSLLSKTPPNSTSTSSSRMSKEESMREYADLKLSLLTYDAALIFLGTVAANFSAGENSALAFFIGGFFGFSYLLLLQRSVDGLPASLPVLSNTGGRIEFDKLFRGFKGPVSGLALAIGITFIAVKYASGDFTMVLTPKELLLGTMGFLACKVAVVLAAFKPMSIGLKENK